MLQDPLVGYYRSTVFHYFKCYMLHLLHYQTIYARISASVDLQLDISVSPFPHGPHGDADSLVNGQPFE